MPSKSSKNKSAVVRQIGAAPVNPENVADHNQIQAKTEMGVPLAPDNLYEVAEGLYESLMQTQAEINNLQRILSEKAVAAAMALGAKKNSEIVLSKDFRYIAVYNRESIERANKEAIEAAKKELPIVEGEAKVPGEGE